MNALIAGSNFKSYFMLFILWRLRISERGHSLFRELLRQENEDNVFLNNVLDLREKEGLANIDKNNLFLKNVLD